jgi:hypothetical protein
VIRGNSYDGVSSQDDFTMSGGVIAGNTGSGVHNDDGDFTTTFIKKGGGVIYGSEDEDGVADGLKNKEGALEGYSASTKTVWENKIYNFVIP